MSAAKQLKIADVFRAHTVMKELFFRYSSMSDIFGLAYLVGQIDD